MSRVRVTREVSRLYIAAAGAAAAVAVAVAVLATASVAGRSRSGRNGAWREQLHHKWVCRKRGGSGRKEVDIRGI